MIVACPSCSTGYLLPEELMGSGGARVRCPRCGQPFTVAPGGRVEASRSAEPPSSPVSSASPEPPPPRESLDMAPTPPAGIDALAEARTVIAELSDREGEALARAAAERRLFAAYGPALMEAYERFRQRAGGAADPSAFREALRERWGVDLLPIAGDRTDSGTP
ncbi:MAG TPA: zinc-ribbon domain-containing protein [Terriglobales bacterium]|nr:zinc-ribbon domain-containing protein [Terriglobales bacterium]